MANVTDLPCDGDGVCMVCKQKAPASETLTCKTCATPWHAVCLATPLKTLADAPNWECPDCSDTSAVVKPVTGCGGGGLVEKIRAIENDDSMTDKEKAKRRQQLLSGGVTEAPEDTKEEEKKKKNNGGLMQILGDKFNCSICMNLLERPVSTPCGHNFCLKCFHKMVGQNGRSACAFCRKAIPPKMAKEPRINSAIVMAIRMAKLSQPESIRGPPKNTQFIHNQDRPDKAFTTERAKKTGKANACSGKIFVTVPLDHFGPILPENDPERKQGVLVGETWDDRMECRQWGAHFPHVAGICGQGEHGAQSVALSGGYEDDEDHGEWFLYTGSGGRDLSGNRRTNKFQSSDQSFYKFNEALRVSCRQGYPVRVVRSHKEKRSSYAPVKGVRYDGIYRIEKCWRKKGIQGFKVCRYLFVRCDNEPAPWTSETIGDRPRPLPRVEELKQATDVTVRTASPSWDYDVEQGSWVWKKPAPESRKSTVDYEFDEEGNLVSKKKQRKQSKGNKSVKQKLLKEFSCHICQKVMVQPLTTPCAHNFCKVCLEGVFAGQSFLNQRTCGGRRALRAQKNVMKCPTCKNDIADFIQNPQVNRELMNVIESLQNQMKEESIEADANGQNAESGVATEEVSNDEEIVLESVGTEEAVDIDVENKENCEEKVETLKEGTAEKDNLKPSRAITPQRVSMRNKAKEGVTTSPTKSPVRNYKRKKDSEDTCVPTADAKSCEEDLAAVKPKRAYKRKKDSEDTCVPTADAKSCEEDLTVVKPKRAYNKRKKDGEDTSELAADAGKKQRTRKT